MSTLRTLSPGTRNRNGLARAGTIAAFGLFLVLAFPRGAAGFDSVCVRADERVDFSFDDGTPFCVPLANRTPNDPLAFCNQGGYGSAYGIFGGEHAFLTARLFRDLGLDDYAETRERRLEVFVEDAIFEHDGMPVDRLTPPPFSVPTVGLRTVERPYTVSGFAELPDFASSLADWASGYQHCAIEHVPRATTDEVQRCHEFTEVLGPVNSNHFVPQARVVFEHYHRLAKEVLAECKRIQDVTSGWAHVGKSRALVDEVLAECEIEGLSLEAIGLHHFQDVFSTGHMWERWASPAVPDADSLPQLKAVAAISGVIHGWRTLVEPLLVDAGLDPGGEVVGAIGQDPLSAPISRTASQYRVLDVSNDLYRGAGDDYVLPCLQDHVSPSYTTLFAGAAAGNLADFEEQWTSLHRCTAAAVADAYAAGPKLKGALRTPAYMAGVDPRIHETDACFSRRATNAAMYGALGIGSLAVSPQSLSLLELGIVFESPLGSVALLTLTDAAEWRNTVVTLNSAFYTNQHVDPSGTGSAKLLFPESAAFGFGRNSDYVDRSVPLQADPGPVAGWSTERAPGSCTNDSGCAAGYVCNPATFGCEPHEAATLRAFHRAHADYWCEALSREDLDELRQACAAGDQTRCDLCVELARRHVRNGCDEASWLSVPQADRVDALCAATSAIPAEKILYAGVLENCGSFGSADEAARRWCESADLTDILPPDSGEPRSSLQAISPGGIEPPAVAPGESVRLEVLYRDASSQPVGGQTIRFAAYTDEMIDRCQSTNIVATRTTSSDGTAVYDFGTTATVETHYVHACPSDDTTRTCNLCDPNTLTFTIRTRTGRFLRKVAGDNQVGGPGTILPEQLTVEVVPSVPDGTMIRFETADVGLPTAQRARLDGASVLGVNKPTFGSRAQVRLTLPAVEGTTTVRATGVNTVLFPDPAGSAVEFTARTAPRMGSLRFAYFQDSPIGPMDVRVDGQADGVPLSSRVVSVSGDRMAVTVSDFAPEGSDVVVTLSGTNQYGVNFVSSPIRVNPFVAQVNDLGQVLLLADRGHLVVRLGADSAPPQRRLLFFDRHVPWPPLGFPGLPSEVSAGGEVEVAVGFQPFVTNAGLPKPRRHLDLYAYTPDNEGAAFQVPPAVVQDDRYLAVVELGNAAASANPPPSEAYVTFSVTGDPGRTVTAAPFKVYDPRGNLVVEYPADWSGGPHWFAPVSNSLIVASGEEEAEGHVIFAANGLDFPASADGLLFAVIDPPIEGFVPGAQRTHCVHDRGTVRRVLQANPASCTTHDNCRLSSGATGVCVDGRCFDFDGQAIALSGTYCHNFGAEMQITPCSPSTDFECGPSLRCVGGQCVQGPAAP